MPARTKRRAKFDFHGRPFVWWVDSDRWLRIASLDKRFVIAYPLGRAPEQPPTLTVHGHEFPGLSASEPRPVHLVTLEPSEKTMGARVHRLLEWAFDDDKALVRLEHSPKFM